MATVTWFPGPLSSALVTTDGDGDISFDTDGSIFVERRWFGPYDSAYALCPKPRDLGVGMPGANVICTASSIKRVKPDNSLVSATYQGTWNLPFTIYQMDASRYEKPIQYHPNFNDTSIFGTYVGDTSGPLQTKISHNIGTTALPTWVFDKFKDIGTSTTDPTCQFRGIEAYMVATATFRKTSYALSPSFDLNGIFKIGAPDSGGFTVPDSGNTVPSWLKSDKTCRNMYRGASPIWEIQESWLYNPNGWLSAIYSP